MPVYPGTRTRTRRPTPTALPSTVLICPSRDRHDTFIPTRSTVSTLCTCLTWGYEVNQEVGTRHGQLG